MRLQGAINYTTTLQRYTPLVGPNLFSSILTTYWTFGQGIHKWYTFLATSDINSRPIEICNITIDGMQTIANNQANPNLFENTSLIRLAVPTKIAYSLNHTLNGIPIPIEGYTSGGSGKLKIFIHDCKFKNSPGDAVLQEGNVDLTMNNCEGKNIYRGTHTLVKGANVIRLKNIVTTNSPDSSTKSIDYEILVNQTGYDSSYSYRAWIDNCIFNKKVEIFFALQSHVLLTNTIVQAPHTLFSGNNGGDLVTDSCEFHFKTGNSASANYIFAPTHAKFKNTKFIFDAGISSFNGLRYSYSADTSFYSNAHIGFENCHFVNNSGFSPAYALYVPYAVRNLPNYLQLFFKNCSSVGFTQNNNYNGLVTLNNLQNVSDPLIINQYPISIVTENEVYTGGESKEQMKRHFGIRPIYYLKLNSPTIVHVKCKGASTGSINITATASPQGIIQYNLMPGNITNTTGSFLNLAAATYTITATDIIGNTNSTTITVTEPATAVYWSIIYFTNVLCPGGGATGNISVWASGGTGAITYRLLYPVGGQLSNLTGVFAPITSKIYTVTANDMNYCSVSTKIDLVNPASADFCCTPGGAGVVGMNDVHLKISPTASQLLNEFGDVNGNIIDRNFYISGICTVDANISFVGCNLWFTQSGGIQPLNGFQLTNNGSSFMPSCGTWEGFLPPTANKNGGSTDEKNILPGAGNVVNANLFNLDKIRNETAIKVYPNPASTNISIDYTCGTDGDFVLYNSVGQVVLTTKLVKERNKVQIQIQDIASGIYQYRCKFESCADEIGKIVIHN